MKSDKLLLESPVFDVNSALKAAKYGVDRLELCSSFSDGGLTPGPGLLSYLKSRIDIPVFVMIRPRGGHFVSPSEEIVVMKKEIKIFDSLGADGFVFGVLNEDGSVNQAACKQLIEQANGKPCTFHRAFDVSSNLNRSLEEIIDCGFQRILTSGGKKNVETGLSTIKKLMEKAGDRIIIMPGGGTKPEIIPLLRKTGYLKEVHASCKKVKKARQRYIHNDLQFTIDGLKPDEYLSVDKKKVRNFKRFF
jgi:copper homeostasis protein